MKVAGHMQNKTVSKGVSFLNEVARNITNYSEVLYYFVQILSLFSSDQMY